LSENKLKSLFTELQFQDKEELKLKRLKADGQDKDGIMEADVRRKLKGIVIVVQIFKFRPQLSIFSAIVCLDA